MWNVESHHPWQDDPLTGYSQHVIIRRLVHVVPDESQPQGVGVPALRVSTHLVGRTTEDGFVGTMVLLDDGVVADVLPPTLRDVVVTDGWGDQAAVMVSPSRMMDDDMSPLHQFTR